MKRIQVVGKVFGFAGGILLVAGVLALACVGFAFYFTYQTCLTGNSPQPDQGCGYILNPAFWQGDPEDALLTDGLVAVMLGILCLAVALASRLVRSKSGPNPELPAIERAESDTLANCRGSGFIPTGVCLSRLPFLSDVTLGAGVGTQL